MSNHVFRQCNNDNTILFFFYKNNNSVHGSTFDQTKISQINIAIIIIFQIIPLCEAKKQRENYDEDKQNSYFLIYIINT